MPEHVNALVKNLVTCAWPGHCVDAGTVEVAHLVPKEYGAERVVLEYCETHAAHTVELSMSARYVPR